MSCEMLSQPSRDCGRTNKTRGDFTQKRKQPRVEIKKWGSIFSSGVPLKKLSAGAKLKYFETSLGEFFRERGIKAEITITCMLTPFVLGNIRHLFLARVDAPAGIAQKEGHTADRTFFLVHQLITKQPRPPGTCTVCMYDTLYSISVKQGAHSVYCLQRNGHDKKITNLVTHITQVTPTFKK